MKHERVIDPVPEEPVVPPVPVPAEVFVAKMVADPSRTLTFSSAAARQAHIDCWSSWMLG